MKNNEKSLIFQAFFEYCHIQILFFACYIFISKGEKYG